MLVCALGMALIANAPEIGELVTVIKDSAELKKTPNQTFLRWGYNNRRRWQPVAV